MDDILIMHRGFHVLYQVKLGTKYFKDEGCIIYLTVHHFHDAFALPEIVVEWLA